MKNLEINKGVKSFQEYKTNPFLEGLTIKTKNQITSIARSPLTVLNPETGELHETAFMHTKKMVDNDEFVKVFKAHLQLFFNLSQRALRVLGYFASALKINDDRVYFDLSDCKEYTKYSATQSIFLGLGELLDKKAIARSDKTNIYFINPAILFNGNRLVVMQEFVKKKKQNMEDPMQLKAFNDEE